MKIFIAFLVCVLGWLCMQAQEVAKPVWKVAVTNDQQLPFQRNIQVEWVDTSRVIVLSSRGVKVIRVETGDWVYADSSKGSRFYMNSRLGRDKSNGVVWLEHRIDANASFLPSFRKREPERRYDLYLFDNAKNKFVEMNKLIGISNNASEIYGDDTTTIFTDSESSPDSGLRVVVWDWKKFQTLSNFRLKDSKGALSKNIFPPQAILNSKKELFLCAEDGYLWRLDIGKAEPVWAIKLSPITNTTSYWSRGILSVNDSTLIRVNLNILECIDVKKGEIKWRKEFQSDWISYASDTRGLYLYSLFTNKQQNSSNLVKISLETGNVSYDKILSFKGLIMHGFELGNKAIALFGSKTILGVVPTRSYVALVKYESGELILNPASLPGGTLVTYGKNNKLLFLGDTGVRLMTDSGKYVTIPALETNNSTRLFSDEKTYQYAFFNDSVFVFDRNNKKMYKADSEFVNIDTVCTLSTFFDKNYKFIDMKKISNKIIAVSSGDIWSGSKLRVLVITANKHGSNMRLRFPEVLSESWGLHQRKSPALLGSRASILGQSDIKSLNTLSDNLYITYVNFRYLDGDNVYVVSVSDGSLKGIIPYSSSTVLVDEARHRIITQTGSGDLSLFKF